MATRKTPKRKLSDTDIDETLGFSMRVTRSGTRKIPNTNIKSHTGLSQNTQQKLSKPVTEDLVSLKHTQDGYNVGVENDDLSEPPTPIRRLYVGGERSNSKGSSSSSSSNSNGYSSSIKVSSGQSSRKMSTNKGENSSETRSLTTPRRSGKKYRDIVTADQDQVQDQDHQNAPVATNLIGSAALNVTGATAVVALQRTDHVSVAFVQSSAADTCAAVILLLLLVVAYLFNDIGGFTVLLQEYSPEDLNVGENCSNYSTLGDRFQDKVNWQTAQVFEMRKRVGLLEKQWHNSSQMSFSSSVSMQLSEQEAEENKFRDSLIQIKDSISNLNVQVSYVHDLSKRELYGENNAMRDNLTQKISEYMFSVDEKGSRSLVDPINGAMDVVKHKSVDMHELLGRINVSLFSNVVLSATGEDKSDGSLELILRNVQDQLFHVTTIFEAIESFSMRIDTDVSTELRTDLQQLMNLDKTNHSELRNRVQVLFNSASELQHLQDGLLNHLAKKEPLQESISRGKFSKVEENRTFWAAVSKDLFENFLRVSDDLSNAFQVLVEHNADSELQSENLDRLRMQLSKTAPTVWPAAQSETNKKATLEDFAVGVRGGKVVHHRSLCPANGGMLLTSPSPFLSVSSDQSHHKFNALESLVSLTAKAIESARLGFGSQIVISHHAPQNDVYHTLPPNGVITVLFHSAVKVRAVSLIHASPVRDTISSSMQPCAPHLFQLDGWLEDPTKLRDIAGKNVVLGTFTFHTLGFHSVRSNQSGNFSDYLWEQSFDVSSLKLTPFNGLDIYDVPLTAVTLRVLSNYGEAAFTCVHRIRVMGELA
jgi:hypothetical protein